MKEQEKQALVTAIRLLAATPKSRKSLQEKLKERGFPPEVLRGTLTHLEKQGLLNDRALAQSLFHSFMNYRPAGRKRIAFELKKRGIQEEVVRELLENYSLGEEREKALELAKHKKGRWAYLEAGKRRKKIYDFLIRRGFDYSLSREIIEDLERDQ